MRFLSCCFAAFAFSLLCSASSAKPSPSIQPILDTWVKGQPGGIVVAWIDTEGVTFFCAGKHSETDDRPLTADTRVEIGSVTKVFTGLLLAEGELRGEVSRNDSVAKYLLQPNDVVSKKLKKITLLSLATHCAGLPEQASNLTTMAASRDELVNGLLTDGPKAHPGDYSYSNVGAALLGEALAVAAHSTYRDLLRSRLLEPLGMQATNIPFPSETRDRNFAPGHGFDGSVAPSLEFESYAPAGGICSSARDLAVFLKFCLGQDQKPPSAALKEVMKRQHATDDGHGIGLCLQVTNDEHRPVYFHGGDTLGYSTYIGFVPSAHIAVAILTNTCDNVSWLGEALLVSTQPLPVPMKVANPGDYVGRYLLKSGTAIDITEEDGLLFSRHSAGISRLLLHQTTPDHFATVGVGIELSFNRDRSNHVVSLASQYEGRTREGTRTELPSPPQKINVPLEALAEYTGEYTINADTLVMVRVEQKYLTIKMTGQPSLPVFPSAKDEFFSQIVNLRIAFQRDKDGKIADIVLRQNSEETRGLRERE